MSIAAARDNGNEVSLGQDADQAPIFDNRKAADLPLAQKACGLDQRSIRAGGDYIAGHHVFDRETVQELALSVLAIAKRLRERVAKELALAHDADEGLTVIIDNGQMSNPSQEHDVVSQGEFVVAFKSGGVHCHKIANFQIFHAKFSSLRASQATQKECSAFRAMAKPQLGTHLIGALRRVGDIMGFSMTMRADIVYPIAPRHSIHRTNSFDSNCDSITRLLVRELLRPSVDDNSRAARGESL